MSSTKRISATLSSLTSGAISSVGSQPTDGSLVEMIHIAIFSVSTEPSPQELSDIETTGTPEANSKREDDRDNEPRPVGGSQTRVGL
ncbi:hypothetical protein BGX21_008869 [Mortierella sp. AD011]|nr:hypothetical protein BGX20_010698 [Mortierella sp. AD010]KAF9397440.1 hypothetical protein BGX21_008869 [Mortierella sp. AD011]